MFELSKSVDGSGTYKYARASTGLAVNHCAVAMSPKGSLSGTCLLTRNLFSLASTVLEIGAEICSNDSQTIAIRRLNKHSHLAAFLKIAYFRLENSYDSKAQI